ncbi:MAG: thioredoxin domain-containing protein, partial [Bacteroidetes bacterium]|nr:thioredoxin domain-containing protein [Bacteroidota bacterium]
LLRNTLFRMARGGFHDHLAGGFHRYSVDEEWIIPHFEKMADDNAWLLRNYIQAYEIFKEPRFKDIAEGIIRFFRDVLSYEEGGFYASQDADVTPDDEGGYFTWTEKDLMNALSNDEFRILKMHLLSEKGSMHHDNAKKVLFAEMDAQEIAQRTSIDIQKIHEILKNGKSKLLAERNKRQSPFIDKTMYTSLNGMVITSFIKAFRTLNDSYTRDFAIKSLDRIMSLYFVDGNLFHSDGVRAMLDDYVHLIDANIAVYEVTGYTDYLAAAEKLMEICIDKLWDKSEGGFFDTEDELLGVRIKAIEDVPHPSSNSIAIRILLKLSFLRGRQDYAEMAEKSLRAFYARAKDLGVHSGNYFNSMDEHFNHLKLNVFAQPGSAIALDVLHSFYPYTFIIYGEDKGFIIPCLKTACYEPINNGGDFKEFLDNLHKTKQE